MKVLSLFSGVGGFDLGLERAGMQTVFQCEWDKHATRILERHWPHVARWDDVSTLTGKHILAHAPVIDIVAWGSPCQDLSVAGKRAGLGGERSGLFHEGVRIIKEMREITNGKYPRMSLWENVAGALSSGNGADFGQVLYEMDEAGACFSEWRLLDAQYFGVPQRRRRVFLVSVFDPATAARCPDPLLPVSESVRRDTETSAATREEPAGTSTQSLASGRDIANTIPAELYHKSTVVNQDVNNGHLVVGSLAARDYKGVGNQYVNENKCVVETIVFENSYRDAARIADGPVNTLSAKMGTGGNNTPMIAFSHTQGLSAQPSEDSFPTLRREGSGMAVAFPIQDGREMEKHQNGLGVGGESDPSYTLDQTGAQSVAYSIREDAKANTFSATELDRSNALNALRPSPQSHHAQMFIVESPTQTTAFQPGTMIRMSGGVWDEIAPTLRAEAKRGDNEPHVAISYDEYNDRLGGDVHHALRAGTKQSTGVVEPTMAVRRLTPVECERLMGWPDDWTGGQADTHRYKQCGNGVASPVAQWIAEQLLQLDKDTHAEETTQENPTT